MKTKIIVLNKKEEGFLSVFENLVVIYFNGKIKSDELKYFNSSDLNKNHLLIKHKCILNYKYLSLNINDIIINPMKNDHYYVDISCNNIIHLNEKEFLRRRRMVTLRNILKKED